MSVWGYVHMNVAARGGHRRCISWSWSCYWLWAASMDAGKGTRVFCRSSKCSFLLSYLSSLFYTNSSLINTFLPAFGLLFPPGHCFPILSCRRDIATIPPLGNSWHRTCLSHQQKARVYWDLLYNFAYQIYYFKILISLLLLLLLVCVSKFVHISANAYRDQRCQIPCSWSYR